MSTNSQELTVKLSENQLYYNYVNVSYELSFYGTSIDSSSTKSVKFEVRDVSGNTVIEDNNLNVATTKYSPIYIEVS